jgi:type IV secretion system protein VirB9
MNKIKRLVSCCVLAGCATVDYEKQVQAGGTASLELKNAAQTSVKVSMEEDAKDAPKPPEVIYVEMPVYVPEKSAGAANAPASGVDSVKASNKEGTIKPSEYSHAARVYDFHPDFVYEIYTQTLRMTDIYLEAGETVLEPPFVSDSERWILGGGVSGSDPMFTQHIYVKPSESNLEATMIINTNKRVYHIQLKSYKDVYMPMVRWNYKITGMPNNYLNKDGVPASAGETKKIEWVDPRYLSFDYRVRYGLFSKPSWLPRLVYDDGKKTYVSFPERVLQTELPAVFENRGDVVNYRVSGDLIIIDKLVTKITIKKEKEKVTIEKKEIDKK